VPRPLGVRTAARILPRVRHLAAHLAAVEVADDAVRSTANSISIDASSSVARRDASPAKLNGA
jgi:hypothetical protein